VDHPIRLVEAGATEAIGHDLTAATPDQSGEGKGYQKQHRKKNKTFGEEDSKDETPKERASQVYYSISRRPKV
jgi:hypothetical protein